MNLKNLCRSLAAIGAAAVLSACGGGAVDEFKPDRVLSFGDEMSLINADGTKYSVNALTTPSGSTTKVLDCETYPIWTQVVASGYDYVFAECNPDKVANPRAVMLATVNAKVADFEAQIAAFKTAGGTFNDKDLATVMVGTHDILELYAQFPTVSKADLLLEAEARGKRWAELINGLAKEGPRVMAATIPELDRSPFGLAEQTAHPTEDRKALLYDLVTRYNLAMRLNMIQDGRMLGVVFGEIEIQNMAKSPGNYGLDNAKDAVCTVALPACTADTVVADAVGDPEDWLWADSFRPGIEWQRRLGDLAESKAKNNPF